MSGEVQNSVGESQSKTPLPDDQAPAQEDNGKQDATDNMAADDETLSSGTTTSGHILGDLSLTPIIQRNSDSSSSSFSSSSSSPFGLT